MFVRMYLVTGEAKVDRFVGMSLVTRTWRADAHGSIIKQENLQALDKDVVELLGEIPGISFGCVFNTFHLLSCLHFQGFVV